VSSTIQATIGPFRFIIGRTAVAHPFEQGLITPRCVGYEMMERLVHALHIIRGQSRGQGLDTFAFTGKKQTGAVSLQRCYAIKVLCGSRQAVQIGRKALLLHAWRRRRGAHAHKLSVQEGIRPSKTKACAYL
jgi:hypothetical protein